MRALILGAGEVGLFLARQLSSTGDDVVLVDHVAENLQRGEDDTDVLTLCGDGTHRRTLLAAEVDQCDIVLAVTGRDEVNVVAAALAAELGAQTTVARVDAPSFYSTDSSIERQVLGIDAVLCASRLVSEELLRRVDGIHATFATYCAANQLEVIQLPVSENSPLVGKQASRVSLPGDATLMAVASGGLVRAASEVPRIEVGDGAIVAGSPVAVSMAARQLLRKQRERRAVVIGGGDVGMQLCQRLQRIGRSVLVIESDRRRCEVLSEALPDATVVHGDGTAIAVLKDVRVDASEILLAVTRADEVNLMAALMAKDLGVPRTFALVHRPGYAAVYSHLGISGTAGSHLVIGDAVDRLMPRKRRVITRKLESLGYAMCERTLGPSLPKPLHQRDLGLPYGSVFLGAVDARGRVLNPEEGLTSEATVVVLAPTPTLGDTVKALRSLAP